MVALADYGSAPQNFCVIAALWVNIAKRHGESAMQIAVIFSHANSIGTKAA